MFRLVTKTLKNVEFQADFSGSSNCDFIDVQSSNISKVYKRDGIFRQHVVPEMIHSGDGENEILEKRSDLAKIILHENWKLKTKFKFTLHNPPREKQEKFIRKDLQKLVEEYMSFLKAFRRDTFVIPFEKIP